MRNNYYDSITHRIIESAMIVHSELGPGLLESVYEACLMKELQKTSLRARGQVSVPVVYLGEVLEKDFRIDILVGDLVVVEVKAVEALLPIHSAQVITYLKLAKKPVGLLINFNVTSLRHGIKRLHNPMMVGVG